MAETNVDGATLGPLRAWETSSQDYLCERAVPAPAGSNLRVWLFPLNSLRLCLELFIFHFIPFNADFIFFYIIYLSSYI